MNFLEWISQQYPEQFIKTNQLLLQRAAWDAGQSVERGRMRSLIEAAEAVIDRWDSPKWKDQEPTAAVIHRLRVVIEKLKEEK